MEQSFIFIRCYLKVVKKVMNDFSFKLDKKKQVGVYLMKV